MCRVFDAIDKPPGLALQMNAQQRGQQEANPLYCTDPPYYDNVPYADLSDFFYVWLRRSLQHIYPQLLSTVLVPKTEELVADHVRHGGLDGGRAFFEEGMQKVFSRLRVVANCDVPTSVFYAFKQTEEVVENASSAGDESPSSTGWETFLSGLIDTGWQIEGTWPLRTELGNRIRSFGSNALASSVVLVVRQRSPQAALATRREFLKVLKQDLPAALKHLQQGSIAPVDLAQAAIGPGMAVFTRYAKVMEADGSPMKVRQALALINQTLDEVLAEQEGEFDADTRFAVAWFEEFGMDEGPFGTADVLSRAKNTAVKALQDAGILVSKGGKVRLLGRSELPPDWDPATDARLRQWEVVQHLIRTLEDDGEAAAADLLRRLGGMAETARDLAYRLYNICERKGWASEALAYNGLVIAWPEIEKLALASRAEPAPRQQTLGLDAD
jgi:putative DNA methylase